MVVRNRQIRGDHGEVLALAAAKGYVLVCGPAVAGVMLVSLPCVVLEESMLMSLTSAATKGYDSVCGPCCGRGLG